MSLWSALQRTYDTIQNASGQVVLGKEFTVDTRKMLMPLFHIPLKTRLHIILDERGDLLDIETDNSDVTVIVPCTEKSMGRSGKDPAPHPLCDQLAYIDSKLDVIKHGKYVELLKSWKGKNVKLNAIYTYVTTHSVIDDAVEWGRYASQEGEGNNEGRKPKADAKTGVRFSVHTLSDEPDEVWLDHDLQQLWIDHLMHSKTAHGVDSLGEPFFQAAANYPKNIVGAAGNAKLVSSNDKVNFTYRGRFDTPQDAMLLDGSASQKVHSALKWLVGNNGRTIDKQTVVVWAIEDKPTQVLQPSVNTFDAIYGNDIIESQEPGDDVSKAKLSADTNYAKRFHEIVRGFRDAKRMAAHSKTIVVAILDAATTGRLSVTFYVELPENDYLESIAAWHESAAWPLTRFETKKGGDAAGKSKAISYIGAPSFVDITNCAYGPGEHNGASYTRFRKDTEKQLIEAMFSNGTLPRPIAASAFYHVLRPESYSSRTVWRHELEVACSIWKKSLNQNEPEKEQISMALDTTRRDRDYLYGRLLALADEFEDEILYRRNIDRPTSAVKLINNFAAKPYSTWGNICAQLAPYVQSAKGSRRFAYENDIDEVTDMFGDHEFEDNSALSPLFLLGYSAQRRALRQKFTKENESVNNDNNNENEQGE